ncbi:NADPH:quinone reductase [Parapusillimonas sp. JC17]|uniref:NADPH:quinone reductase n=1 Tax=Parapusillimonas sp. JC17 TaxID=3445768 RepID=UPI003F9FC101
MRAAWYSKNGKAQEVLEVGELPDPTPGPGEVRVRLHASGVNPSDAKSRAGSRPVQSGFIVPHSDGAGVIDQVGEGVAQDRIGERVWIWNGQWQRSMGTAAEYIALPSGQAVALPDWIEFEEAACLGIPAMTAFHAVELLGDLDGKTILVTGAASGVGFYAAQFAMIKGARVLATVGSAEKAALLARIGVSDVILYKDGKVAEQIKAYTDDRGVDGVVDLDFSSTVKLVSAGAVAHHGVVVSYGSNVREGIPFDFGAWLPRSISLHFFLVYELRPAERAAAIEGIDALLQNGRLQHVVGASFDLSDIVRAHQAVEAGQTVGNVVVTLPPLGSDPERGPTPQSADKPPVF